MPRKPTVNSGGCPNKTGPKGPKIPIVVGIPPKEIILEQVLYWIDLLATAKEIAGSFWVSVDTLDRRLRESTGHNFAELSAWIGGTSSRLAVRRNQLNLSKRNAQMAIHLGKNWLGQTDGKDPNITPPNDITNEERRLYDERIGALLAENKRLKSAQDVGQATPEYPRSE